MKPLRLVALAAATSLVAFAPGCSSDGESSPVAPAQAPQEFFGVVPQSALTTEDIARMGEGNVGTIRIVVPWQVIAPEGPDQPDYSYLDPVVLEAAKQGIEVLPTLSGTPDWVAHNLDQSPCDIDCANYPPRTDAALEAWKEYVGQMVERYGPDGEIWAENPDVPDDPIHSWQIWNEQNSPTFFQPKPDPEVYANLLKPAAAAIHSRDPDGEVILGGMFATPNGGERPAYSSWQFLRKLYAIPGTRDSFDAIAAHPYSPHLNKIRDQVSLLRDEVARADDDAEMWITEVGASSSDGANPLDRGPEGQAEVLQDVYDFFVDRREAWDIQAVTWYSWRDGVDASCEWCQYAGLFPADSLESPKPAWQAFVGFTGGT